MNAVELVKKFSDQTFIFTCKANISKPVSDEWKHGIKLLSENHNVSCKISGMVMKQITLNLITMILHHF